MLRPPVDCLIDMRERGRERRREAGRQGGRDGEEESEGEGDRESVASILDLLAVKYGTFVPRPMLHIK